MGRNGMPMIADSRKDRRSSVFVFSLSALARLSERRLGPLFRLPDIVAQDGHGLCKWHVDAAGEVDGLRPDDMIRDGAVELHVFAGVVQKPTAAREPEDADVHDRSRAGADDSPALGTPTSLPRRSVLIAWAKI